MKRVLGLLILCALPLSGNAQLDLNALKRESDSKAQQRKNESDAFLSSRKLKWDEFLKARGEEWAKVSSNRDIAWTDFLSGSEWEVFDDFLRNKQPEKPKPVVEPKVETEPVSKPKPQPVILPDNAVVKPAVVPEVKPEPAPLPIKPTENKPGNTARFSFYGREVSIAYDPSLKSFSANMYSQKEISDFWKTTSAADYSNSIVQLLEEKEKIGLNDWGYYLFVSSFSKQMYFNENCARLLTWFILVRSGLDARVGYNDGGVVLLLPTQTSLYDMSYVKIDGVNYYVINNSTGNGVHTCPGSYADGRQFDFNQRKPLKLGGKNSVRSLSFEFNGQSYSMDFNYDADLAEYYKALPQAQFEVFFSAAPSDQLKKSITANLKPIIQGMDKPTALDFLLQFVQLSFPYKTDPQQFGYEKYFYADELFFYPYCDCEDRSVLFAYLAHELMGYDVVGTEFPEHMATAVEVDYQVNGTKYRVGTHTYTVADPTYMRASVGQCMSRYENTTPIIHKIDYTR